MVGVKTERLQICIERKKEGGKKERTIFIVSSCTSGIDGEKKKKNVANIY